MSKLPHIDSNIEAISRAFKGILLDAYGVFWGGNDVGLLPGAKEVMERLVLQGKTVGILSNTTQLSAKEIEKVKKHGLIQDQHFHFFVTSGEITKQLFSNETLPFKIKNNKYFLFGRIHPKFASHQPIFEGSPYSETSDINEADFIYISIPHIDGADQVDLDLFRNDVQSLVESRLPMICPNPDRYAHEGNPPKAVVRQGSIALLYESFGGQVFYTGKPGEKAYQFAMKEFSKFGILNPQDVLMVGDTPETDIRGAKNFGMPSLLLTKNGIMADRILKQGPAKAFQDLENKDTPEFFVEQLGG